MGDLSFLYILGTVLMLVVFNSYFAYKYRYPEVAGNIIIGIFLGVSWLKILDETVINSFSDLTYIAVGIMAFGFGSELNKENFKQVRFIPVFIVAFESLLTFLIVFIGIYNLFDINFYLALILGAISAGTTPGATMSLLRQFRAKGRLTTAIVSSVGLDNIMAFFLYSITLSIVQYNIQLGESSFTKILTQNYLIYFSSIILGVLFGIFMYLLLRNLKSDVFVGIAQFALIILNVAICRNLDLYIPLSLLVFGMVVANIDRLIILKSKKSLRVTQKIVLSTFFIFAGANLNISLIDKIGFIGLTYFILRATGKILGTYLGATISNAEKKIRNYLGFALLPQVGVALTLAFSLYYELDIAEYGKLGKYIGETVFQIAVFTTIFTETIGPILTTIVLKKNNEIKN